MILQKVSFDKLLFEKEFKKSITYILPEEVESLAKWVETNYSEYYAEVIKTINDLL